MGEYQQRYNKRKAEERRQIAQYKKDFPELWAAAVQAVQVKEAARLAVVEKARLETIEFERLRARCSQNFRTSLIVRAIPQVSGLQHVQGRIALRQWDLSPSGWLLSNGYSHGTWQTQMIADEVPTVGNSHGLYCVELTPEAIMQAASSRVSDYCGIIELRGHIEYHEQEHGIRAEWARILSIFVLTDNVSVFGAVPKLIEHYPGVPLFVTVRDYVAKYLVHVAMWQETGDERMLYNVRL